MHGGLKNPVTAFLRSSDGTHHNLVKRKFMLHSVARTIFGFGTALSCLLLGTVAQADTGVIQRIVVEGGERSAEVKVEGAFPVPEYSVRARDGGRVVVLQIQGTTLPDDGVRFVGGSTLVRSSSASSNARGVRLELTLASAVRHQARAATDEIILSLAPAGSEAETEQPASTADDAALTLSAVHVERRDGRERLVVELNQPAAFRVVRGEGGQARLELRGVQLASTISGGIQLPRNSLLRRARVMEEDGVSVVQVEHRGGASATAIREGSRIVWLFSPRSENASVAHGADGSAVVETAEVASFLSDVPLQVRAARGRRRYGGRRVDLDFKDADIHNILRLLSEVGGVNIVTSDEVQGTVTIRMRNVPWDQALDVILQAKGLGMVRRTNLIRVALMETLEQEREAAIARQKQREQLSPLETRLVPVSYATATELQPRVQELLSGRGSVSVDERTNVLIVRDIRDNLGDVEELVRTLDTQTPQVLVEARIVEATSNYTRDVGIQWGGSASASTATGNPTGLAFPSDVSLTGGAFDDTTTTAGLSPFVQNVQPANYAVNLPALVGTEGGALGLSLGSIGGNIQIGVRLSALESNGTIRIVSAPRILTLDNHEAHIAQGTLIPYSQVSAQGVQTAFQEAKLELAVRPHVTSDGAVAMHVEITRDEPDFNRTSTRGDPTILKREAETDLLIDDGHTAVIGGIYTRNTGRTIDQVPFFGDIPVLGVLFQRRRISDDRNELLIFLTPRIVNRSRALQRSAG